MSFRFRQFSVEDEQSTLRVGTDAMLLGSWAAPGKAKNILDIGTGCGALALMMAQKSDAWIDAVDCDQQSVDEARNNFLNSPWPSRIRAIHGPVQELSLLAPMAYHFIITNPPYFSDSLKSTNTRINRTRHDDTLPFTDLVCAVSRMLVADGCLALILPSTHTDRFQMICAENGLFLSRKMIVYSTPASPPKRTMMDFCRNKTDHPACVEMTILDTSGKFTQEYLELTWCFHNF
jgi:tRNA1Val (adenine37-N6)-methyltransferase